MQFKFEKLHIWQDAMSLGEHVQSLVNLRFPEKERFNLSSQIMRAVDSVALNIAEGSILQTSKEQQRFMVFSIRSLAEAVTCLHKAKERNYITLDEFESIYSDSYKLMNMMIAFRKKLD